MGVIAVILLLSRASAGQPLNFVVINLDDTRHDGVDLMQEVLQPDLVGEGAGKYLNSYSDASEGTRDRVGASTALPAGIAGGR